MCICNFVDIRWQDALNPSRCENRDCVPLPRFIYDEMFVFFDIIVRCTSALHVKAILMLEVSIESVSLNGQAEY